MELSFPAVPMPSAELALICELNNCAANRKRATDVSEKPQEGLIELRRLYRVLTRLLKKAPKPNLFRADRIKSENNLRQVLMSL